MPDRTAEAPWLAWLLEGIHQAQWGLLQGLHVLGMVGSVDGQPAWPLRWRLSGENLLIDLGQARALLVSLAVVAALLALLLACRWRAARWALLIGVLLAGWLAPWPAAGVLFAPAHPTSFHTPDIALSDQAIGQGAAHYKQHCLRCHGERGNGQGPDAPAQAVWPPSFVGPLLWRRADGDLLWAIRQGLQDRHGHPTMPGFAPQLSVEQTWELLYFLRALAAGQLLQVTGNWAQPIALPNMPLRCHNTQKTSVQDWRGQRVRLTTSNPKGLLPDPRLVTLWLPAEKPPAVVPDQVDCVVTSISTAQQALALINGRAEMQDMQLLTDRAGWLRARNSRGAAAWSDDDLLCRTVDDTAAAVGGIAGGADKTEDQLSRIIRLMDAEPVRYVKDGRVH